MIIKFCILFFFASSILCEDHIPRSVDPDSESLHQKISKESTNLPPIQKETIETLKNKDVKLGETSKVKSIISEKDIPSVGNQINPSDTISGGTYYIHNPSYITFTMIVPSQSVDCYYYKAADSFEVDYQVLKGGNYDIALVVYDSNNKKVAFQKSSNDGNVKIIVPKDMINKDYSICFDNYQSSRDTKRVYMMIDVSNSNLISSPEYAQLNKLDLMHTSLTNIYTSLNQVEHLQEKQRAIEAIDRSIMERNYEYVTMWCMIQITIMILVSGIQLILIRSLFDSKGGIGATIWRKLHDLTGGRF